MEGLSHYTTGKYHLAIDIIKFYYDAEKYVKKVHGTGKKYENSIDKERSVCYTLS